MEYSIKDIVKENVVRFDHYREGIFYYIVKFMHPTETQLIQRMFPVPAADIGNATLQSEDKAILFMRYIRKAIEDGTFVQI